MNKRDITILHHGRAIKGSLLLPVEHEKCPLVILSHGYNGSGAGFEKMANYLTKNGIGAFYYDFCGGSVNSKSSMETTSMTIFTEKEDLCAVLETVKNWSFADQDNIYLFGESQGGLVSALVASEHENDMKGMLLLYPALCVADNWNERFATVDEIPDEFELWGMKLGKKFFTTLRDFRTFEVIGGFGKKVFIMHGDMDPVVPLSYSQKLINLYPDACLEVFEGEGHGFSEESYNRVCQITTDFIHKVSVGK